jgi:hypothetical protein
MRSLLLVLLIGCSLPTRRGEETYKEKYSKLMKDCIVEMVREGIDQRLVFPICNGIYNIPQQIETIPQSDQKTV